MWSTGKAGRLWTVVLAVFLFLSRTDTQQLHHDPLQQLRHNGRDIVTAPGLDAEAIRARLRSGYGGTPGFGSQALQDIADLLAENERLRTALDDERQMNASLYVDYNELAMKKVKP